MEGLVNMDIRNTIYECSRSTEGITKGAVNLKWTPGKSEDEKVAAQKKLCAKVASTEPGALDAFSTCFATNPSARPTRSHKLLGPPVSLSNPASHLLLRPCRSTATMETLQSLWKHMVCRTPPRAGVH